MSDVHLYLIAFKKGAAFSAPIKVGVSSSPFGRLDTLQTACPYELGIVGSLIYPSREIARQMENCFHETHSHRRLRGEWFDIEPTEALAILRLQLSFALDMFTSLSDQEQEQAIALCEAQL